MLFMEASQNESETTGYSANETAVEELEGVIARLVIMTTFFFQYGITNLLAVAGITGNTINIIVLRRHGVVNVSTNIMLISLSTFDLLYSVTVLLRYIQFYIGIVDIQLFYYINELLPHNPIFVLDQVWISISVTITSAIAIERFVAVFFPFLVARIFTPVRVKCVVVFIVFYVSGIISPVFVDFDVLELVIKDCNNTECLVRYEHWWTSSNVPYYHEMVVNQMFGFANIIIVVICGTTTALKLVNTTHRRQRLTSKNSVGDKNAHKMLLLVCGTCFLVFGPTTVVNTAVKGGLEVSAYYILVVEAVLYGIHSSVNFVIYVAVSRKFYTTYRQIFCRK